MAIHEEAMFCWQSDIPRITQACNVKGSAISPWLCWIQYTSVSYIYKHQQRVSAGNSSGENLCYNDKHSFFIDWFLRLLGETVI